MLFTNITIRCYSVDGYKTRTLHTCTYMCGLNRQMTYLTTPPHSPVNLMLYMYLNALSNPQNRAETYKYIEFNLSNNVMCKIK